MSARRSTAKEARSRKEEVRRPPKKVDLVGFLIFGLGLGKRGVALALFPAWPELQGPGICYTASRKEESK